MITKIGDLTVLESGHLIFQVGEIVKFCFDDLVVQIIAQNTNSKFSVNLSAVDNVVTILISEKRTSDINFKNTIKILEDLYLIFSYLQPADSAYSQIYYTFLKNE